MPLCRLIYISKNELDRSQGSVVKQLEEILSTSQRNNKAVGITGALLFDDMWFLQVLEGKRGDVWRTFQSISLDNRHSDLVVVEMVEIAARSFGNWWMALTKSDTDVAAAFEPFLSNGLLAADRMKSNDILAMMIKLAQRGLHRELAVS